MQCSYTAGTSTYRLQGEKKKKLSCNNVSIAARHAARNDNQIVDKSNRLCPGYPQDNADIEGESRPSLHGWKQTIV